MRKALIQKVVILFGHREIYFDHDEAKSVFERMKDMLPSLIREPWPVVIYEGFLHWTAARPSWESGDKGASARYTGHNETLTLTLSSQTHIVEPEGEANYDDPYNRNKDLSTLKNLEDEAEAPALDAYTEDHPDTELVDAEVDAEHDDTEPIKEHDQNDRPD
jgi:hypothetical protein